jgi:hypothetical protein
VLNEAPHHEDVWGVMIWLHAFLIPLVGDEALRPGCLIPREGAPGAHWIADWVGYTDILMLWRRGKSSYCTFINKGINRHMSMPFMNQIYVVKLYLVTEIVF